MRRFPSRTTAARGLPLLLLVLALPACDLGTTVDNRFMSGEWLTVQFLAQNANDPAQVDTLIPNARWFRYMSFGQGGYQEDKVWSPENHWDTRTGLWNSNDSIVAVRYTENDTLAWPYEIIDENHVRLTIPRVETHDFDGDSVPDLTNEILRMVRAENNPDSHVLGTWVADHYTFTSVADTSVSYDVIQDGGNFSMTLFQTATYQYSETIPGGGGTQSATGSMAAMEGLFWLMYGNNIQAGTYSVQGSTLTIDFPDAEWDFNGDGTDEPATLQFQLHKTM